MLCIRRIAVPTTEVLERVHHLLRTKSVADIAGRRSTKPRRAHGGLKRTLTTFDLVMLGIGAVIGAGIFSSIGTAAVGEVAPDGTVTRSAPGPP